MASISSLGTGSGVLTSDLLEQLIQAERAPVERRLDREKELVDAKISGFGAIKSSVSTLSGALSPLASGLAFRTNTSESSNEGVVTGTASSLASPGSYRIETSQLAEAQTIASDSYAQTTTVIGTGTLSFTFGTTDSNGDYDPVAKTGYDFTADPERTTQDVVITDGSLEGIRDAVNAADIGVQASLVNDGSGYRLLFTSEETGEGNSMQITSGDVALADLTFAGDGTTTSQTVAAADAELTVNGLAITRESNLVTEVIRGVTLNLKGTNAGSPATLTIARDSEGVQEKVNAFVEAFNEFKTLYNAATDFNAETGQGEVLQGDATLRSLNTQIRREVAGLVEGLEGGTLRALSDVGISSNSQTGLLSLDSAALTEALNNNPEDLAALFATDGRTSDSLVDFNFSSAATQPGEYAVNISQLATQGSYASATPGLDLSTPPVNINDSNNSFVIQLNGTTSGTIDLSFGNYNTGAELAEEIQAQINNDSTLIAAGDSVTVTYDGTKFDFVSNKYGSNSTIAFSSLDAGVAADLGIGNAAATATAGLNVAGTINGVTAKGTGQLLAAAAGDDAAGINLTIRGEATGDRGSVTFIRGIASSLDIRLDSFLKSDGLFANKTSNFDSQLAEISAEREALEERLEAEEARLARSFAFNDALVAQLNTTGDFVTNQLSLLEAMFRPKE